MTAISIGPLSFSVSMLAFFAGVLLAFAAGKRIARTSKIDVEPSLWMIFALAMLAARTAFVVRYYASYIDNPVLIIDIRDGGFMPLAGGVVALATAAWVIFQNRAKWRPLLGALAVFAAVWGIGSAVALSGKTTQKLPEMTLVGIDGRPFPIAALAGRPVVINLWASWCPPCRREMPVLAQAQAESPDVVFVFANQGESAATVSRYLTAEKLPLKNVVLDSKGSLADLSGSHGLPTTLFFNQQGRLVERRAGELSPATLAQRLDTLRAERLTETPSGATR